MAEVFQVNSDHSLAAFIAHARQQFAEHKFVTYRWRIGADRSLDQNALFHVWLTEWIAHKLGKDRRQVEKAELAGIKRTVKKLYYQCTGAAFMVHEITDYSTGRTKVDYTSSKDWARGEMYDVLCWLQMAAAEDGCVLEAKGEFAKLKRQEAA